MMNQAEANSLPLVMCVEDLVPMLRIGRNKAYELVRSGQIRSVRIGHKYRIPRDAIAEFLAGSDPANISEA